MSTNFKRIRKRIRTQVQNLFAFCNSGVNLAGLGMAQIFHSIPLGIALGLFIGKQLGVFAFCWLGIKLRFAELPKDISCASLYGTAALCGIGCTMSLFIGSLASGVVGFGILRKSLRN